jgi:hypothetical protein
MAKKETVIDWGEFEEAPLPQMTPSTGVGKEIPLESKVSRGGFEYVLQNNLRAGLADLTQLLTLVPRFGATAFNYDPEGTGRVMERAQESVVSAVGPQDIPTGSGPVQKIVAGGVRAVPTTLLPGPKGATLFTKSPREAGEAAVSAFGVGAGMEAGRIAGEGSAFEIPAQLAVGLSAGIATNTVYNLLSGKLIDFTKPQGIKLRQKIYESVGEENFQKMLRATTAGQLNQILKENPNIITQLDRVEELRELIPGFAPNLFQASGATTVRLRGKEALERQPEFIPQLEQQTEKSAQAVRAKTAELFPVTESSFAFAGRQQNKTQAAIATLVQKADQEIENLSSQFVRTGKQDIGQRIRASFEARKEAVNKVFKEQYTALDQEAAQAGVRLPKENVSGIYNTVEANREVFESSPELLQLVQNTFKPRQVETGGVILNAAGQPVTPPETRLEFEDIGFDTFRSLSRRVNQDFYAATQAAANQVPGAGRKAFVLGQLKQQVDASLDALPSNISSKFKSLNQAYDDQYREVFKKGLGGIIGAKTRLGERILDEDLFKQLTKESNVDDFYKIFGNTPEAQDFLTTGLVEKFLNQPNSLSAAGTINQEALTKFIRQNEGVIGKVPKLQEFLSSAQTNIATWAERKNAAVLGRQQLENSALASINKKQDLSSVLSLSEGGAFKDLNKLSQLIGASKADPSGRALKGLQGSMIEKAFESADPAKFLQTNQKAFERAFGSDYKVAANLVEAMSILSRKFSIEPPVRVLEGDVLQKATGSGIPQVFSILRDRITSVPTKAAILFSRLTQSKGLLEKDKAFLEVFKDPAAAKEALKYTVQLNSPVTSQEVKSKAMEALTGLITRYGVNLYRAAEVGAAKQAGEVREEAQQERQQGASFNDFETVE